VDIAGGWMLFWTLGVLLLAFVQAMIPGAYLTLQVGAKMQQGPRDDLPPPTIPLKRSQAALRNLHESLPIFLTLAVLSILFAEQGALSQIGAAVFLLARIAHVICYIRGLSPWRSFGFAIGFFGLVALAVPIVPHLWS
jgi:uncharacterized MAPEG superfamily protein